MKGLFSYLLMGILNTVGIFQKLPSKQEFHTYYIFGLLQIARLSSLECRNMYNMK